MADIDADICAISMEIDARERELKYLYDWLETLCKKREQLSNSNDGGVEHEKV